MPVKPRAYSGFQRVRFFALVTWCHAFGSSFFESGCGTCASEQLVQQVHLHSGCQVGETSWSIDCFDEANQISTIGLVRGRWQEISFAVASSGSTKRPTNSRGVTIFSWILWRGWVCNNGWQGRTCIPPAWAAPSRGKCFDAVQKRFRRWYLPGNSANWFSWGNFEVASWRCKDEAGGETNGQHTVHEASSTQNCRGQSDLQAFPVEQGSPRAKSPQAQRAHPCWHVMFVAVLCRLLRCWRVHQHYWSVCTGTSFCASNE